MSLAVLVLLAAFVGYMAGSIPSGMIVARVYRGVDLTAHGSGRTGATNVLRTLGPGAAAIAFLADAAKGAIAVIVAIAILGASPWAQFAAAGGAVFGHTFSPFIGFKGGRGVVTGLGATLVVAPLIVAVCTVVGALVIAVSRYVSLGSVVGAGLAGTLMVVWASSIGQPAFVAWGVLLGGFIILAHRDNIHRLLTGTERRLGKPAALG